MNFNQATKFDAVSRDVAQSWARTGGASKVSSDMGEILENARVNTDDTFSEQGRVEVSLAEWNHEFTRNVEFTMANHGNALAVANLKHYGFKP